MSSKIEFPAKIVLGWNTVQTIGVEVANLGRSAMFVYSARTESTDAVNQIIAQLKDRDIRVVPAGVDSGEPTVERVESLLVKAEHEKVDFMVGMGGGSVLDVAKAVAGLCFKNRKSVRHYFYGVQPESAGIPWVAIPTTSGTGAEATPNSVLSDGRKLKQSIRGDGSWIAKIVILDPSLTVSCPRQVTAWSGLDALTQAIESYTSIGANPVTEPYSIQAARLVTKSLLRACNEPADEAARTDMALGSLLAGIALANARLGIVHGIAHSIGLRYLAPHGLVCGTLLPWAMEYNESVSSKKYAYLATICGLGSTGDDLIRWIKSINQSLNIPTSVKSFGLERSHFEKIVDESMPSGSLKANPRPVTRDELYTFLETQLVN